MVNRLIAIVVLALSTLSCLDSNSTKGLGTSKSIEVPSLNLSLFQNINFASEAECRDFVTKNSGNKIK